MDTFAVELRKELKNYNPLPINSLIFTTDGRYLIAGGDDETVRIWNTETFECDQTLENEKWGQVTALTLIDEVLPNGKVQCTSLCVGSGRGFMTLIPIAPKVGKPFKSDNAITSSISAFNDPIEVQAYDISTSTLAIASHSGEMKVFSLNNLLINLQWSKNVGPAIPSGIFFGGETNQTILTTLLETSELLCIDLSTGDILWKKVLTGGIGGATFSDNRTLLLFNNLSTGNFDLYRYPEVAATKSFPTMSTRRFTKQCWFLEGNRFAVYGSDKNHIKVVDISESKIVHTLSTGKDGDMTQTIAVTCQGAASNRILIAAESGGSVFIWEKVHLYELPGGEQNGRRTKETVIQNNNGNWKIIVLVIILTYSSWSPYFFALVTIATHYYRQSKIVLTTEGAAVITL